MAIGTSERRRSRRLPAAYEVTVLDDGGRFLTRGRVANISENGMCFLVERHRNIPKSGRITLQIKLPPTSSKHDERRKTRNVSYTCKIVRTQTLGNLVGIGVEFIDKLS